MRAKPRPCTNAPLILARTSCPPTPTQRKRKSKSKSMFTLAYMPTIKAARVLATKPWEVNLYEKSTPKTLGG